MQGTRLSDIIWHT